MAGKTELVATFLILNLVLFPLASAQLLTAITSCVGGLLQVAACGPALNLIKIGGITDAVTSSCCALIATLTPVRAGKCLCAVAKINVLGLVVDVNLPGDINLLLKACGQQVQLLGC
uniref:Protease inhibitor/seed storage/lipid transfer protein family protein n=1 Tax=Wolffia australiana TaxID=161112 RepID=H6U802_WOLAU|nr:protease inhibitor/seed storage/lipid transfer protein family protein [Wolffia australiana]